MAISCILFDISNNFNWLLLWLLWARDMIFIEIERKDYGVDEVERFLWGCFSCCINNIMTLIYNYVYIRYDYVFV
jgi:hypothetical protein